MFGKVHKLNFIVKSPKATVKIGSANYHNRARIGNRDWVAFAPSASYYDTIFMPFPAIRFRENTNELLALREKEKGDWRKLTIDEKKTLYRASFRQTLAEIIAPTGEWKTVLGGFLIAVSAAIWLHCAMHFFVHKELPNTFCEEHRKKMLRAMLVNKSGIIRGISSKWDYENDDWKK